MRFDTNAFFGHWPYWPLPQTGGQDVLRLMDRFGIERAAITSLRGLHGDWHEANVETLELAGRHPDRFTPIGCMSPMRGGGADALRRFAADGGRGVRLYPQLLQGYSLAGPFADEVAAAACELGLPVIVATRPMMNFRFAPLPIADVESLAARHPGTTVILSGPNYLSEFRTVCEAIPRCANLFIEVACMQGFQAVARLVGLVGADRVLFGTGMVLHAPACNVAKLDHARIKPDQRRAIAWANACRIFGVSG